MSAARAPRGVVRLSGRLAAALVVCAPAGLRFARAAAVEVRPDDVAAAAADVVRSATPDGGADRDRVRDGEPERTGAGADGPAEPERTGAGADGPGEPERTGAGAGGPREPEASRDGGAEPIALPAVTIRASRTRLGADPTAAATEVLAADFAGELRSTADLVAQAPGAGVHGFGGPGSASSATIRGASSDEVAVTLDGIPLAGATGGGADLSALPERFLERVDVVRGPVGALYGAGALGGAIDLVSRELPGRFGGEASVTAGSFGTYRASAAAGGQAGATRWLAALDLFQTAGDFPFEYDPTPELPGASPLAHAVRAGDDARRAAILAKVSSDGDSGGTSALVQATAIDRGVPGPRNAPASGARERDGRAYAAVRASRALGDFAVDASVFGRADALTLGGSDFPVDEVDRELGGIAHVAYAVGPHTVRATLSAAGESLLSAPFSSPSRASSSLGAAWEWRAAEPLLVVAAARADQVGPFAGLSPRLGFVLRHATDSGVAFEARAGGGASFRAPTFFELYYAAGPLRPNPALVPETAAGLDGAVAVSTGPFRAAVSVFGSRYRELILYETYPPDGVRPFNLPGSRLWGGELEASWRRGGWLGTAGYSLLASSNDSDVPGIAGNPVPYRTPHRLTARLAWSGESFRAFVDADVRSRTPANRSATVFLAARAVLGAGVQLRLGAGFWLGVEATNLLDEQSLEDVSGYPIPGRAIDATLRWELSPTPKEEHT